MHHFPFFSLFRPGFIDFIPRFRALGEKCLVGHLDEQKATLLELLQRIHLNPTSERSLNKSNGHQSHGVVSVGGFIAPRVVGTSMHYYYCISPLSTSLSTAYVALSYLLHVLTRSFYDVYEQVR